MGLVEHLELHVEVEVCSCEGGDLICCGVGQQDGVVDESEEDGGMLCVGWGGEGVFEGDGFLIEVFGREFCDGSEELVVGKLGDLKFDIHQWKQGICIII